MISKKDLDGLVDRLTELATAGNVPRRYTLDHGSATQGNAYRLNIFHPDFSHPRQVVIGKTRAEAQSFLRGFLANQQEIYLVIRQKASLPADSRAARWFTPEPRYQTDEDRAMA